MLSDTSAAIRCHLNEVRRLGLIDIPRDALAPAQRNARSLRDA